MGIFDNETLKAGFESWANFASLGMYGAVSQTAEGSKMAKEAQKEIENYKRQELVNPYEGITVSRLGSDLRREEVSRGVASGVDYLEKAGSRGVGGVAGLVSAASREMASIGAYLDEQQKEIDKLMAAGQDRVMQMKERREEMDLAGLAKQYELGLATKQAGQQSMQEIPWKVAELGLSATGTGGVFEGAFSKKSSGSSTSSGYTIPTPPVESFKIVQDPTV